jgi:peroxiredoxin
LAEYRDRYDEIRAAGAEVVAISVDRADQSERLRRELELPFPILSDADRRVVREWNIFNPREHGGIAKPSVFVITTGREVLFSSIDSVHKRVPASDVVRMLRTRSFDRAHRRAYAPRLGDFARGLRNLFGR